MSRSTVVSAIGCSEQTFASSSGIAHTEDREPIQHRRRVGTGAARLVYDQKLHNFAQPARYLLITAKAHHPHRGSLHRRQPS